MGSGASSDAARARTRERRPQPSGEAPRHAHRRPPQLASFGHGDASEVPDLSRASRPDEPRFHAPFSLADAPTIARFPVVVGGGADSSGRSSRSCSRAVLSRAASDADLASGEFGGLGELELPPLSALVREVEHWARAAQAAHAECAANESTIIHNPLCGN